MNSIVKSSSGAVRVGVVDVADMFVDGGRMGREPKIDIYN